MEKWAGAGEWDVNWVCICVNGDSTSLPTAQDFATRYKMKAIVNGYIPSQSMLPSFGQLGCQGLIIVDKNGNFITRKSEALMRKGQSAFRAVERRLYNLGAYLGDKPASAFEPPPKPKLRFSVGTQVECRLGPTTWIPGQVIELYCEIQGREMPYKIRLRDGRVIFAPVDQDVCIRFVAHAPIEIESVGVKVMDEEHESCANALRDLRQNPCAQTLLVARDTLKSHFEHEEEIFAKTGFGNHGTALSGTKSHCQDHAKILSEINANLSNVTKEFVEELINHVTKHTADFDSKYKGKISETSI